VFDWSFSLTPLPAWPPRSAQYGSQEVVIPCELYASGLRPLQFGHWGHTIRQTRHSVSCLSVSIGKHTRRLGLGQASPSGAVRNRHWPGSSTDTHYSWLWVLLIALDGNFKMKRKNWAIKDPDMSMGHTYFVEDTQYQEYLPIAPSWQQHQVW
jgi:hypothetical protein